MSEWLAAGSLPWLYAIGLLILGFVLILLEIFVIPGMNIFGILGFGTVCIGVLFAYNRLGLEAAVVIGTLGMGGTAALVWMLVRNRAWQHMVREARTDRASGYDAAPPGLAQRLGEVGAALTPLRPSGRARFGDEVLDVVTEGSFLDPGAQVEIIEIHGNRVVVHDVDSEAPNRNDPPSTPDVATDTDGEERQGA